MAQDGLQTNPSGAGRYTVIGPGQRMSSSRAPAATGNALRPVNGNEEYISDQVAYAHYAPCGHNFFFKYNYGFRAPSRCPRQDGGFLEVEDLPYWLISHSLLRTQIV